MKNQLQYINAVLFIIFLFPLSIDSIAQSSSLNVFVGNQGNFGDTNGSVSVYDPVTNTVSQDVVPGINTLIQSMTFR